MMPLVNSHDLLLLFIFFFSFGKTTDMSDFSGFSTKCGRSSFSVQTRYVC